MKNIIISSVLLSGLILTGCASSKMSSQNDKSFYAPTWDAQAPNVDAFNYTRAETDLMMKKYGKKGFGKFAHSRAAYDIDNQITQTGNRDTIYSFGVFDLAKSDLTITLPDSKGNYMTLMPISEDHDVYQGLNAPGTYTFKQAEIGTRYMVFVIRVLCDPNDPKDMSRAHKLQDGVVVTQSDKGDMTGLKDWNEKEVLAMRQAFSTLGSSLSSSKTFFGVKGDRSYLQTAMGVAVGWGGMQEKDALYLPEQVENNDGKTAYTITIPKDVPVDGFWSVTVYNKERYMVKNKYNSYAFNSLTAEKNADGTATLHLGGDPKAKNFLYTPENWVYFVRFYQPHQEILDGSWVFPKAVKVK